MTLDCIYHLFLEDFGLVDKFDSSEPDTLQHADEKVFSAQCSFSSLFQPTKTKTISSLMEPPKGLFKVRF